MNAPDVRRLLEDLGSFEPPAPDDEFLDRLEFQLRAEAIALAPDTYDDAPWRLPFGIAAAAFSVVVGVAGITVLRDLPDRQVSAQLAAVSGVEVTLADGTPVDVKPGMAIPEGAIVRVKPGGRLEVDGVQYKDGQTLEVKDGRLQALDGSDADGVELAEGGDAGGPTTSSGGEPEVDLPMAVPPESTEGATAAEGPDVPESSAPDSSSTVPSTAANPEHDASRVEKEDPARAIGVGDNEPGPTPKSTTESTTTEPTTTAPTTAEPDPTTTAPSTTTSSADSSTSTSTSTSTTTPSTTTPSTGPSTSSPTTVPGGRVTTTDQAGTPGTAFAGPPGGTTTTTKPGGKTDPPVGGDGGDGEPVDPGGDVSPAGGDEGEPFGDGTGTGGDDVAPDSGNESATFSDGTGGTAGDDDSAGDGSDETAAADDTAPGDTTGTAPGSS